MPIPERFLDELNDRLNIVEVVSAYVPLTKKGANYWGLCPFHHEKTPSFSVNAEKQIFHCFGCGKGGGAIRFLMEMENCPSQTRCASWPDRRVWRCRRTTPAVAVAGSGGHAFWN